MITVYGIKNCDTVRKARKWLDGENIAHQYHDFRSDGLDADQLAEWVEELGWESLLNRRGTTWRKLPDSDKSDLNAAKATALMLASPAIIKRPVFDLQGTYLIGFGDDQKAALKAF